MGEEKSKALRKLAIYLTFSIVLLFLGTHPRITEERTIEPLQSVNGYEWVRSSFSPSLPEFISPVIVDNLGAVDAFYNIIFVFVSILWAAISIPSLFLIGVVIALTGIFGNSWENLIGGCVISILGPLLMLVSPLGNFAFLINQDNGTVAYYVVMAAFAAPVLGLGVLISYIGSYQPIAVIILRR